MKKIITQIYEIQDPYQAEAMVELGIDNIGSVILSEDNWKVAQIKETVNLIRETASKSCLIPLFSTQESIFRVLDYYQPDIVHFCDDIFFSGLALGSCDTFISLQKEVKTKFPEIEIMRSIPIAAPGMADRVPTLKLADMFESVSDYFLTDTLLINNINNKKNISDRQPVENFIGITGTPCDWNMAAELVERSGIPVILAGGISPENVFDGIMYIRPFGIDSCTNTNAVDENGCTIRFKKDIKRVSSLMENVKKAEKVIKKGEKRLFYV
jgi:phosphoribosylanthranilate isomerase